MDLSEGNAMTDDDPSTPPTAGPDPFGLAWFATVLFLIAFTAGCCYVLTLAQSTPGPWQWVVGQ